MAQGPGLGAGASAVQAREDVELVDRLRHRERLLDEELQGFVAPEEVVDRAVVQVHLPRARAEVDARDRGLALAGPVILDGRAQRLDSYFRFNGCGFWAWWGWRSPA